MMIRSSNSSIGGRSARQHGIVLIIVLIMLASMTLAAISLFRSVDTNVLIAGNLAFKQTTIMGSDAGIQNAINTVGAMSSATLNAGGAAGYIPNQQVFDFTGTDPTVPDFDWNNCLGAGSCRQTNDGAGNTVLWVVHRMCSLPGSPLAVDCVRGTVDGTSGGLQGSSQGNAGVGGPLARTTQIYYRITTRVTGPRNTLTYAQAIVK
jgi:Tfp pilus assembly protein PilX